MILTGIINLIVQAGSGLEAITASRIFPVMLPEVVGSQLAAQGPALTYQVVGGSGVQTFDAAGPQRLRVQFDCFGATYQAAITVREALRTLLERYQGTLSDGTWLQNVEWIQPIDFFDSDARIFRCACEFYLFYSL